MIERQALALGWLLSYFDDEDSVSLDGWLSAAAVVLFGLLYGCVAQLVCPAWNAENLYLR